MVSKYETEMKGGLPAKEYMRKWYEARRNTYKAAHLKKTYGISLEDLFSMLEDQDYKCAICEVDLSNRNPKNIHIDHCHDTDKIRSVLCSNCNMALGLLKHDPEILASAIEYLEKHNA